ncbi:MAG: CHASE2 domain-containing protein [Burkholderiaceae bacterium]
MSGDTLDSGSIATGALAHYHSPADASPRKSRWRRAVSFARLAGALAALGVGLVLLSWQRLDGFFYDALVRSWYQWAGPRPAPEVVLAVIDEATLTATQRPLAQWQPQLAAALDVLARGGARVVGLDVVLTERAAIDQRGASLDLSLLAALARHRERMPVILAQTSAVASVDGATQMRPLQGAYGEVVGAQRIGSVLLPLDADGTARRLPTANSAPFSLQIARVIAPAALAPAPTGDRLIDYRLGAPLAVVSLRDAFANAQDDAWLRKRFADRPVLVGAALAMEDRLRAPRDPTLDGGQSTIGPAFAVAVQAQAVRSWLAPPLQRTPTIWPVLLTVLASGLVWTGARGRAVRIWMATVAVLLALLAISILALAANWVLPVTGAMAAALVAAALATAHSAWHGWQERSRLARVFGGYVSPRVFEQLVAGELDTRTRRLQNCAFLSADIRNFTALTESIGPTRVLELLNRYYARAAQVIHAVGGTVEDFRGDGLGAFFGAPQPMAAPAEAALQAARELLTMLPELNRALGADGLPTIEIGIGLSAGPGVAGHVGSPDRYHYAVFGRAANLAARLEALCKPLAVPLVAAEEFVAAVPGPWRSLGAHQIKGLGTLEVFTLDL